MNRPRTQAEIDMALHQFGQHMRKAWDVRQAEFEKNIAAFREGVRDDWEAERARVYGTPMEPPTKDIRTHEPNEPEP